MRIRELFVFAWGFCSSKWTWSSSQDRSKFGSEKSNQFSHMFLASSITEVNFPLSYLTPRLSHIHWSRKCHCRGREEIHYSIFHETLTLNSSHNWTTECLSFLIWFVSLFFQTSSQSGSKQIQHRRKMRWNCWKRNRLTGMKNGPWNCVSEWADLILTLLLSCYNLQFSSFYSPCDMMFHWVWVKERIARWTQNVYKQEQDDE